MGRKLTKTQKKRLVQDILSKSMKLYTQPVRYQDGSSGVMSVKDMEAIERLCAKWMKRIG
jgi:hypothetical protein